MDHAVFRHQPPCQYAEHLVVAQSQGCTDVVSRPGIEAILVRVHSVGNIFLGRRDGEWHFQQFSAGRQEQLRFLEQTAQ